jgi:hypothetical protein
MDPTILLIAVAAFVGGIISSLVGYLTSGEAWSTRKFVASLLIVLIAGVGFSLSYQLSGSTITWADLLTAFFAGAGGDALINRIAKAQVFNQPLPPA